MGQSSPTVDQLRLYLLELPKDQLVSREDIKDFCGTTDSTAYRAFLRWVRDAGIAGKKTSKGQKQHVAAWEAGELIKAAEIKRAVDPNKAAREFHDAISDIWLKKAVKLIVKELPKAILQVIRSHPRGFALTSVMVMGMSSALCLSIAYNMGRQSFLKDAENDDQVPSGEHQITKSISDDDLFQHRKNLSLMGNSDALIGQLYGSNSRFKSEPLPPNDRAKELS